MSSFEMIDFSLLDLLFARKCMLNTIIKFVLYLLVSLHLWRQVPTSYNYSGMYLSWTILMEFILQLNVIKFCFYIFIMNQQSQDSWKESCWLVWYNVYSKTWTGFSLPWSDRIFLGAPIKDSCTKVHTPVAHYGQLSPILMLPVIDGL